MNIKENGWHDKSIDEICARLAFLESYIEVRSSKGNMKGADVEVTLKNGAKGKINIEVQQYDSGAPWTNNTIPTWRKRHDLCTFIILPQPTVERVRNKTYDKKEYAFFRRKDVFLISDSQISEMVGMIASHVVKKFG